MRSSAVTYIVFADEGQGFARRENNRRFMAAMDAFFAEHLGRLCEPPVPEWGIAPFFH
jgi:hypothetical protein